MHRLLALFILLALTFGALAQDTTGGLVRVNNPGSATSLNPLLCDSAVCAEVAALLFPTLLGIDYQRGIYAPAAADNNGLARSWDVSADGTTYTYFLRDDRTWSDGTPITAYDVFFSYLIAIDDDLSSPLQDTLLAEIRAVLPMDARTLVIVYAHADCTALDHINFPVLPAHVFDADFVSTRETFSLGMNYVTQFEDYLENRAPALGYIASHPFNTTLSVTSGPLATVDVRAEYIRMRNATLSLEYVSQISQQTAVDYFFGQRLELLIDPPTNRRRDVVNIPSAQVYTYPGTSWHYIALNLADRSDPQPAYDDDGTSVEQGVHPLFGNVQVRRALQLALDVDALIEAAYDGYARPIASSQPPSSWAYNPDLQPFPYNPAQAADMLEAAGWRALSNDARTCIGCATAADGTRLSFTVVYEDTGERSFIIADLIRQQWSRVGIDASFRPTNAEDLQRTAQSQRFDAYMASFDLSYPVNPDQTALFASTADVPGEGFNTISYNNPQVDLLLEQARTVPGCDLTTRAERYREVQAILREDQPYLWLFTPQRMTAATGDLRNFAPLPNMPYANLQNWVIKRLSDAVLGATNE